MSKRCELQKEYYQANGNYKGKGKYSDDYVSWLEEQILEFKTKDKMKNESTELAQNPPFCKADAVSSSCECGKYTKCCRKIHSNSYGKLWIETDEHFRCGKVQNQILKMKQWWDNNYR